MNLLKLLKIHQIYLPASKKERESYLERVRTAVDRYKPKIEERTGANLGEILVKDYKDILYEIDDTQDDSKSLQHYLQNGNLFEKVAAYSSMGVAHLIRMVVGLRSNMKYLHLRLKDHSSIYINFGLLPKGERILEEMAGIDATERDTVHELSHALWYALGGEKTYDKNEMTWNEGFATYCELDWFRDLYPDGYFIPRPNLFTHEGEYIDGRKKIENLVQEYGEEILLRIPSEWTKFDSQTESKEK